MQKLNRDIGFMIGKGIKLDAKVLEEIVIFINCKQKQILEVQYEEENQGRGVGDL